MLNFRLATFDDWEMLLEWRNDPATRNNSLNSEVIDPEPHKAWLKKSLDSASRKIYIFEDAGKPVGTLRVDSEGEADLLSWTISPNERGKGYGTIMLKEYLKQNDRPVIAYVKPDNIPSIRMVEKCGFSFQERLPEAEIWRKANG